VTADTFISLLIIFCTFVVTLRIGLLERSLTPSAYEYDAGIEKAIQFSLAEFEGGLNFHRTKLAENKNNSGPD
jgi:hypothetical protein